MQGRKIKEGRRRREKGKRNKIGRFWYQARPIGKGFFML